MIEQHLDIATSHIKPETLRYLDCSTAQSRNESGWPGMTVASYEHGVFVTVPEKITAKHTAVMPPDLCAVLVFARQKGVSLVRLDQSADEIPHLPVYAPIVRANTAPMPSKADIVVRMKREILSDISAAKVPATIKSFGELHSHVDANEYGGFCDDRVADQLEAFHGRDGYADLIDECQGEVNQWLESGRATTPEGGQRLVHRLAAYTPYLDDLIDLLDNYSVKLIDGSTAPQNVIFEGFEECLRAMYEDHWDDDYPGSQPVF